MNGPLAASLPDEVRTRDRTGLRAGVRRAAAVVRKDLLLEWRGREATTAMAMLALIIALLLGLTLGAEPARAPAMIWVALGFAAMLGVPRLVEREAEQQTLETLLLYPGSREHLFWGKWAALVVLLTTLLAVLLLVLGILFNVDLWARLPALAAVGILGIVGLASAGTLFASLVVFVRGRALLMPLLLLPVILPVMLAEVRLMESVLAGSAGGMWFGVLLTFDVLFLLVCPILFEVVVEET